MVHPGSGIEPVVCALKYGCRALCVRWAEAQSGPGAVDGDLAHGLHAMAGKGSGEPVAVQVSPKLSALRVADPGQAVRLRCGYRSILSVTPGGAWVAVAGEREAE